MSVLLDTNILTRAAHPQRPGWLRMTERHSRVVGKCGNVTPRSLTMSSAPLPAAYNPNTTTIDVEREVAEVMANPEEWLDTPNERFEGRPPRALINTNQEQRLRDLIGAVKHGLTS
jgi:hypothetical protein